jgi:hypothetical protein
LTEDTGASQVRLTKQSPEFWRVTFDHQPLNIFGRAMIPQLEEDITALETDEHVKVVVFDSAVDRHARPPQSRAGGVYRVNPWTRDGGRQRARSRQRHALHQSREGAAVTVGSGCGPGARRRTDAFVNALANRIASFDKQALAETKHLVNVNSLPSDAEIAPEWDAFLAAVARPAAQARIKALFECGSTKRATSRSGSGFTSGCWAPQLRRTAHKSGRPPPELRRSRRTPNGRLTASRAGCSAGAGSNWSR